MQVKMLFSKHLNIVFNILECTLPSLQYNSDNFKTNMLYLNVLLLTAGVLI